MSGQPEDDSQSQPPPGDPGAQRELKLGLLLFGACAVLFWPALAWLGDKTLHSDQLQNAFILGISALAAIAWRNAGSLRTVYAVSRVVLALVAGSVLLIVLASLMQRAELVLAAMLCTAAALVKYVWGTSARILLRPAMVGFVAFLAMLVLMPIVDWPLRTLSGLNAAEVLHHLGWTPQLNLVGNKGEALNLVLTVGRNGFIVAPECNGFGLIGSSLLLSLILSQASKEAWWWRALTVPVSMIAAFLLNVARILTICLLAQRFPGKEAYDLIHETAGIVALWAGIALVWWLSGFRLGIFAKPPATPAD